MILTRTKDQLRKELAKFRSEQKSVGFVPTMGAMHKGHFSLIEQCNKENDCTVVSIFVNPRQFNNTRDLQAYPRDLEGDLLQLEQLPVDLVFAPTEKEMYPSKDKRHFKFGPLGKVMEGKHRPGHFSGVAHIVSRLFELIEPDRAYFGEKDYQQLIIIRELTKQMGYQTKIIGCPVIRELDGLAMSSRNQLLPSPLRDKASSIYDVLFKAASNKNKMSLPETEKFVTREINNIKDFKTEYFEIRDEQSLRKLNSWEESETPRGFIAVHAGKVRLIDNIKFYS